jgi:hypothetical protein
MDELTSALEARPRLSDNSKRTYTYNYNRLMNILDRNEELNFISQEYIIDKVNNQENTPPQSKNCFISVAVLVKKHHQKPTNQLEKYRDDILKKEINEYSLNKKLELSANMPNFNQLETHLEEQYTAQNHRNFIINYILINYGTRNLDLCMVLTRNSDVIKPSHQSNINYLYLTNRYAVYVRNNYKTKNTYGRKIIKIYSNKFVNSAKEILDGQYETPLFSKISNDKALGERSISVLIKRATFNQVGEGTYFKVLINHYKEQANIKKIKELSSSRGTALATVLEAYDITSDEI